MQVIALSSARMLSSSAWSELDCCHIYVPQEEEREKNQCRQFSFKPMRPEMHTALLSNSKKLVMRVALKIEQSQTFTRSYF